ncbi:hypothetical protein JKP88DRAFT_262681 [Tribonema minus]|uniref:Uncharacterized protein n=1 Tax=Tribonema minus TaxID=303371 RepID=A0A835Z5C0_9STRA|nr:hypothetical protein JKP88DRAFT_262681 [Tribonema minus]
MNISGGQKVYVEDPRTGRLVEVRQAQQAPTSAAPQPTQPNQLYTLNPDGTLRPYSEAPNPAAAGGNAPYVGAANSGVGGGGYGASPGVNTYQKKKRPGGGMLAGLLGALTIMEGSRGEKMFMQDPRTGQFIEVQQAHTVPSSGTPQTYILGPDGRLQPATGTTGNAYGMNGGTGYGTGAYGGNTGYPKKKKGPGGGLMAGLLGALTCGLCIDACDDCGDCDMDF